MLKFIHVSDTHLGYYQYNSFRRFVQWGRAFQQVVNHAVENKVDFVIHAGDLFHSYRISSDTLLQAVQVLELLKEKDIPFYVIEGNHDRRRGRLKASIFDVLERLGLLTFLRIDDEDNIAPNIRVYEKAETGERVNFVGLGYPGIHVMRVVEKVASQLAPGENNIVLLHAGIKGYAPDGEKATLTPSMLDKLFSDRCTYMAVGHYHKEAMREKSFWHISGSTERDRFTDGAYDKYFLEVTLRSEGEGPYKVSIAKKRIKTQKMFSIDIHTRGHWGGVVETLEAKLGEIKQKTPDLSDCLVRVVVKGILNEELKQWELEELLQAENLVFYTVVDRTKESQVDNARWKMMRIDDVELEILQKSFTSKYADTALVDRMSAFTQVLLRELLDKSDGEIRDEKEALVKKIVERRAENFA
ncbi:MAG: metallophosphoesterase family protein [Promethearchaeota archaeon]